MDIKECATVTDVIESAIQRIRKDSFGEESVEISDYERKLVYAGFMMANELFKYKHLEILSKMGGLLTDEDEQD